MPRGILGPPPEPLKSRDGELYYRCPLCGDASREGHLRVNSGRGVWHCYRCGEGGHVTQLRRLTGTEYPWDSEAAADARLTGVAAWLFPRQAPVVDPEVAPGAVDYEKLCPVPGLISQAAADAGGLGNVAGLAPLSRLGPEWWAATGPLPPGPWGLVAAASRYLALRRKMTREDAVRWGLLVATDPAAGPWQGRVVFPGWAPVTGCLRGFTARAVADAEPRRYLAARSRPTHFPLLYGPLALAMLAAGDWGPAEPVLVEGPMDALRVEAAGLPAVALMGKCVLAGMVAECRALGLRRAVLLLDSTEDVEPIKVLAEAGTLAAAGFAVRVARLPAGDPGAAETCAIIAAVAAAKPAGALPLSDAL